MFVPAAPASAELIIKGSRFLSEVFIIQNQAEVRTIIKEQKNKYSDATHVCHAFISGKNAEVMGMSDDGEPGGTAGRPMLDVLKGRSVTNILVTVTRWFGGTLLGTGGLVHAYGDSVKQVLDKLELVELIDKSSFSFKCDYAQYQILKKLMQNYKLYDVTEDFGSVITVSGQIAVKLADDFKERIFDSTNGQVQLFV
ncbi:MAG TPA: YigZ family protein [Treponema sp.]|nr:YigZ family protein [Treponema sp.]